jgi:hypothetical protein
MKIIVFVLAFGFSLSIQAKEWKSLRKYQKITQNERLSPSDWLASDRRQNSQVWQKANAYNLTHNRSSEYQTIKQYRDFYFWIDNEFTLKGHQVVWQKMAYFISCKLRMLETFPHGILVSNQVKAYARQGSQVVFNSAFERLKILFSSDQVLINESALLWDKTMLHDEQYLWIESVYKEIEKKSLKQIERMARGQFLYALVVPKAVRFKDNISKPEERYQYALHILRPYCITHLK